jgi:hypothetical protein
MGYFPKTGEPQRDNLQYIHKCDPTGLSDEINEEAFSGLPRIWGMPTGSAEDRT